LGKRETQAKINKCLSLCHPAYKLVKNYVKPHIVNSPEHEVAKFLKTETFK